MDAAVAAFLILGRAGSIIAVLSGARELYRAVDGTLHARSEAEFDAAAGHMAAAVKLLGVAIFSAMLTRGAKRVQPAEPVKASGGGGKGSVEAVREANRSPAGATQTRPAEAIKDASHLGRPPPRRRRRAF